MPLSPQNMSHEKKARLPSRPIEYSPELDPMEEDEAETAAKIVETLISIAQKTYVDGGHAMRAVHAKSHGILKAELEVAEGLPPQLAQGIFARPARYQAVMRFSTIPGDMLPDSISTPRGVAIKVIGVDGERLPGAAGSTQDFILVNTPTFNAPSAKSFLSSLKLLAATTDKMEGAKKAVSTVTRMTERLIETFGGQSSTLRALGGEPPNHILGETFWTQAAIRFGRHIAKLQLAPASTELKRLTDKPIGIGDSPDALRNAVNAFLAHDEAVWELRAQLATDLDDTPIDDLSTEWTEDISPFVTVARLTASRQTGWSKGRSRAVDDGMGFSPWHGVEAHRPLGPIMRMRKPAYELSQRFRTERNPTPVREPDNLDVIPD